MTEHEDIKGAESLAVSLSVEKRNKAAIVLINLPFRKNHIMVRRGQIEIWEEKLWKYNHNTKQLYHTSLIITQTELAEPKAFTAVNSSAATTPFVTRLYLKLV